METLSYGYKKPETGDKGEPLFEALAENIQKTNDHAHNGTDSSKLSSSSIDKLTQAIDKANWVVNGTGYSQDITLIGALKLSEITIEFRDVLDNNIMYLDIQGLGEIAYKVFCNDNTKDITAIYG